MNLVDYLTNLEARNSNGLGNNQDNPTWGAQDAPLLNLAAPHYSDGVGAPRSGANAREISNAVLAQDVLEPSSSANSDLFTFFGQFIDHDIDLTPNGNTESMVTSIPDGDGVFDPGSHLTLDRSVPIAGTGTDAPRQFANEITSYVDASNIYGSTAELTHMLRANDGANGKSAYLLTSEQGGLPTVADFRAVNPDADLADVLINPRMSDEMFVAGDVRANENAALTSIHLMWVREHNLRVDELRDMQPGLSEDELFEGARVIVEAEYQNIVFNEYLPQLVGLENIPAYAGYDSSVDASIASEFSTAAFRLGHSQISSKLQRLNEDGSDSHAGHLNLFQAFFNPANLQTEDHLSTLIRGLSDGVGQEIDTHIVDDVRNLLFGSEGQGSDLGALNIMRGRDHGLATLNETREALGLAQYTDFSELTSDVDLRAALQSVYHDIDDVELWVGGLSEDTVPGSQLGSTFHIIVLDQFVRLRDGDRFFFEERLADNPELLAEIKDTSLSDIITRTTDVDVIQTDVFVSHNRLGGTDAADVLDGTDAHDVMIGFDGDDVMSGGQGNDDLYGGRGNDTLNGGQGDDVMHGGEGNNTIVGGAGYNTAAYAHGIDALNIQRTEDGTGFLLWNDDKFDLLFDVDHVAFNDGSYDLFDDGSIVNGADKSIHNLIADGSSQFVTGTPGTDAFVINAPSTQYQWNLADDGVGIVVWNPTDDTDFRVLHDIEFIQFDDITIDLEPVINGTSNALSSVQVGEIVKLYIAYFGRAPEQDGLDFHKNKVVEDLNAGATFATALDDRAEKFFEAAIIQSDFTGYSAHQSSNDFVSQLYTNILARPGDGGEAPSHADQSFWADQIDAGTITRGTVIQRFLSDQDILVSHGTPEEKALATQAKALFDNRVAVGLEFAKPENSAGLTLADAFQAGKAALDLVTSDPASVAQAIATFATSTTVSAATVGFDFSADASADPDASSNELVGISTANDVDQYAVM